MGVTALAAVSLMTAGLAAPLIAPAAANTTDGVRGAIFTTDSAGNLVNGNIYDHKTDVWLNGGPNAPAARRLAAGTYFFAVLEPGTQSDPNDGATGNLSRPGDSTLPGDPAAARTFTTDGDGTLSPTGTSTHLFSTAGGVQLAPYATTTNPGGQYIVAVCRYVEEDGVVQQVAPRDCKYDAFKVREDVSCELDCPPPPVIPPTGSKSADPEHERTVTWSVGKSASPSSFQQLTAGTSTYTITVTKTVHETWSVTGVITVDNDNAFDLPVTVHDNGLRDITDAAPDAAAICVVTPPAGGETFADGSAAGTVPAKDTADFAYACDVENPGSGLYRNTATVGYLDAGNEPRTVPVDSGDFDFSVITQLGDPEQVTLTDSYTGGGSPGSTGTLFSDSGSISYQRTFFNANCATYPNTATLSTGAASQAGVRFCGPNDGGLTMGWWQNNNGQALLRNNTASACATLNGRVGAHAGTGQLIQASSKATGSYSPAHCTGPNQSTNKSYLPTFTLNAVKAANASGTGNPMLLGQWLTTTLNTANYPSFTSAGRPTLSAAQTVANPAGLLGLPECTSVGSLLGAAVTGYAGTTGYSANKATVTALATLFDHINNNRAQTCQA